MKVCLLALFFSTMLLCIASGTGIKHCKSPYPPADTDKVRMAGCDPDKACSVGNEKPIIGTIWKYTSPDDKDTDPKDIKCFGRLTQGGEFDGMDITESLACTLYEGIGIDVNAVKVGEIKPIEKGNSIYLYCLCASKKDWTVGDIASYLSDLQVEGKTWDCIYADVKFEKKEEPKDFDF